MSELTDYDLVKSEIGAFIGTPEQRWDNRTRVDVESSIRRGIEMVVHSPDHQWSWMRPSYEFQTSDGQRRYTLPLDFEQFIGSIYFDGSEASYPEITQKSAARLMQLYSEYDSTGVPCYYALEVLAHDGTIPQNQQLILHPTPDSEYSLVATYQVGPIRSLTPARPWFPGGPENQELFISSILAATESKFKDMIGEKHQQYQLALAAAISRDYRRQPRNLGQMGGQRRWNRDYYRWKLQTQFEGHVDSV